MPEKKKKNNAKIAFFWSLCLPKNRNKKMMKKSHLSQDGTNKNSTSPRKTN